jgi:hypothetical protein
MCTKQYNYCPVDLKSCVKHVLHIYIIKKYTQGYSHVVEMDKERVRSYLYKQYSKQVSEHFENRKQPVILKYLGKNF